MAVRDVTRDSVESAIDEFRRIGTDAMLKKYGGARATRYYVRDGGGDFDQKLVVRAAHVHQDLGELPPRGPGWFNARQAYDLLDRLGFTLVDKRSPSDNAPPRGGGSGRGGGGDGEGPNHKALRLWVQNHPKRVVKRLRGVETATEVELLSGDRVDVVYRTAREIITIEVKSRDSGWADLQRGVYQCVKYRAVMEAQEAQEHQAVQERQGSVVRSLLVTESPLPADLNRLAKQLGVSIKVVSPDR